MRTIEVKYSLDKNKLQGDRNTDKDVLGFSEQGVEPEIGKGNYRESMNDRAL